MLSPWAVVYVPGVHSRHVDAPEKVKKVPEEHEVHFILAEPDAYVPARQDRQKVELMAGAKVPAAH